MRALSALSWSNTKLETLEVEVKYGIWRAVHVEAAIPETSPGSINLRCRSIDSAIMEFPMPFYVDMAPRLQRFVEDIGHVASPKETFNKYFYGASEYDPFFVAMTAKAFVSAPASLRRQYNSAGRTEQGRWTAFMEDMQRRGLVDDLPKALVSNINSNDFVNSQTDDSFQQIQSNKGNKHRKSNDDGNKDNEPEEAEITFLGKRSAPDEISRSRKRVKGEVE